MVSLRMARVENKCVYFKIRKIQFTVISVVRAQVMSKYLSDCQILFYTAHLFGFGTEQKQLKICKTYDKKAVNPSLIMTICIDY